MGIKSSTPAPAVLSPTQQRLAELTRSLKKMKEMKAQQGNVQRPRRSADPVDSVDSVAYSSTNLDPSLYDVQIYNNYDDSQRDVEYIPYPFHDGIDGDYDYDVYDNEFTNTNDDDDYSESIGDEIIEFMSDSNNDFEQKKEDLPIVQRTWLDNVILFRDSLFGRKDDGNEFKKKSGKPQVKIHYPNLDKKPVITVSQVRKPPLKNAPSVFVADEVKSKEIPLITVTDADPSIIISTPTSVDQPSLSLTLAPTNQSAKHPISSRTGLATSSLTATAVFSPEEIEKYGIKLITHKKLKYSTIDRDQEYPQESDFTQKYDSNGDQSQYIQPNEHLDSHYDSQDTYQDDIFDQDTHDYNWQDDSFRHTTLHHDTHLDTFHHDTLIYNTYPDTYRSKNTAYPVETKPYNIHHKENFFEPEKHHTDSHHGVEVKIPHLLPSKHYKPPVPLPAPYPVYPANPPKVETVKPQFLPRKHGKYQFLGKSDRDVSQAKNYPEKEKTIQTPHFLPKKPAFTVYPSVGTVHLQNQMDPYGKGSKIEEETMDSDSDSDTQRNYFGSQLLHHQHGEPRSLPPTMYKELPPRLDEQITKPSRSRDYQPPTLTDYLPPTLFDDQPKFRTGSSQHRLLPPKLGTYLPPTLSDPLPSLTHQLHFSPPKLGKYRIYLSLL